MLNPLRGESLIRAVDAAILRRRPAPGGGRHILLAPPGAGNIGDQALVEAFVEAVDGPVTVLTRSRRDIDVAAHLTDRMTVLPVPALVYGTALGHARDARTVDRALDGAASFSVLGADIMDGAYVPRASVNRAALAERLADRGWSSRVVGFSWNDRPDARALAALRRADAAGVRLYVRDPRSAARARADGLTALDSADIVFASQTADPGAVDRLGIDAVSGPFAIVNASGLVGDRTEAYVRTIRRLRDADLGVVVVPHVSRHGADDLPPCRALAERFAEDPGVGMVTGLLSPREIRGLAARAVVTVTGRMHLAVMSLMAGVPAITVATQGKVEGLMDLFGLPELCVSPSDGFAQRMGDVVATTLASAPRYASTIREALPRVRELALANVEGIAAVARERVS
ncbi:polysaccharide pyruvyl transferase family protein [Microbacterium awajiense]|uniref:Polysaccharide pyruvyl transferase family protein n=2 Tax=Microbacterium awajiense TaxID=415214 RepID=A0ABP7AII6_9MICO